MHKHNLIKRHENKKLKLETFRLQHACGERMTTMFVEVVKKILNENSSDRLMPMELWFVFVGNWNV
jgi:hypothetical protein